MRHSKFTKVITSIVLCGMLTLGLQPAAMARTAAQGASPARSYTPGDAFQGTRAELVATAMPFLMEKAGYKVQPADRGLVQGLRLMFHGREDFQWDKTLVKSATGGLEFSVTLPVSDVRMSNGELVLGVIERGVLARAFVLETESGANRLAVRLSNTEGALVGTYQLAVTKSGWLKADRAQLLGLAGVLVPTQTLGLGGLFDQIIALLDQILDLLYFVRDIVNMAICAVSEVEQYIRSLEGCGWADIKFGGGFVVNMIVCTVGETIDLFNDIFGYCI